ncbi:TolC family protein [Halobacteriovorax sp. DPLXC-1]|uniref:TolC family protein n=1 Tax=Halobacteriovorax sp. DPLXC-1 TaxID=3110771 RepID=UPI002FEEB663
MKYILLAILSLNASANLKSYVREYLKNSTEIKQAGYNFELAKLNFELQSDDKRPWTLSLLNEFNNVGLISNPNNPNLINTYKAYTSAAELSKENIYGGKFAITGSYIDFNGGTEYEGYNQEVSYTQDLGKNFLGRNDKMDKEIAAQEVYATKYEFDAQRSQNVLELIESYFDYKKTKTLLNLKDEAKKRAVRRLNFVQKQVRDGLRERVDLYSAQAQVNSVSEEYAELESQLETFKKSLESKLERGHRFSDISLYRIEKIKLDPIEEGNIDSNLTIQALNKKLESLNKAVEKFDNSVFPTIELMGAYKTNAYSTVTANNGNVFSDGTFGSDNDATEVGLTVVIPLGFSADENSLKQAKINRMNTEYQQRLARVRTKNQLEALTNTMRLIDKTIDLVLKRHKLATLSVKEYNKLYSRGRADFDNVISAEERLINTENKYVEYISRREKLYFNLLDIYGKLEQYFY